MKRIVLSAFIAICLFNNGDINASQVLQEQVYVVILAGGKGSRLWPLSRQATPKQLLSFDAQNSLLEITIERALHLVSREHLWVVTTDEQQDAVIQAVGDKIGIILTEPAMRNTGPAVLLTLHYLNQIDPHAFVVFIYADHVIDDQEQFCAAVRYSLEHARHTQNLVLIGVRPTHPATGYGYIELSAEQSPHAPLYKVASFHEKPSLPVAEEYISRNNMLWNTGICCARISTFIDEFKKYAPRLTNQFTNFLHNKCDYTDIDSISVDYAVMEKSDAIYAYPATFDWCDVGNLDIFLSLKAQFHQNKSIIKRVNATNNIIETKKPLVALIEVSDLCVIETDDVLLIGKRQELEKVKQIVQELVDAQETDYL